MELSLRLIDPFGTSEFSLPGDPCSSLRWLSYNHLVPQVESPPPQRSGPVTRNLVSLPNSMLKVLHMERRKVWASQLYASMYLIDTIYCSLSWHSSQDVYYPIGYGLYSMVVIQWYIWINVVEVDEVSSHQLLTCCTSRSIQENSKLWVYHEHVPLQ